MYGNVEELVRKISHEAGLDAYETMTLLHDINNLRGDEWLDVVEEYCSAETIEQFKKVAEISEDDFEE